MKKWFNDFIAFVAKLKKNKQKVIASHISHFKNEQQPEADFYDLTNIIGGLAWYKTQYEKIIKFVLYICITLLVSILFNIILFLNRPAPIYFAATNSLQLAPMIPLNKPFLSETGLLNWCADTVTDAISLDFLHWRKKLAKVRSNFTADSYKSFLNSLKSSGILEMIEKKRLSVAAVISAAPVIVASGEIKGIATWKIEFPIVLSYESANGVESTQNLIASVLVCRSNTATTPRGVVVKQIVLKRGE